MPPTAHVPGPESENLGTVPAGAGSTVRRWPGWARWRDHPRGRGEHKDTPPGGSSQQGPSPRARGAPQRLPAHP